MRAAAAIVRAETGQISAKSIGREIARRVVAEFIADLEADPLDQAFAAIERDLLKSPFHQLATSGDINLYSDFVKRRIKRLEARHGHYLSPAAQGAERREIAEEMRLTLGARYDRQLRS